MQEQLCCALQHKRSRGGGCGFKQDQKQELHKIGSTGKQGTWSYCDVLEGFTWGIQKIKESQAAAKWFFKLEAK